MWRSGSCLSRLPGLKDYSGEEQEKVIAVLFHVGKANPVVLARDLPGSFSVLLNRAFPEILNDMYVGEEEEVRFDVPVVAFGEW